MDRTICQLYCQIHVILYSTDMSKSIGEILEEVCAEKEAAAKVAGNSLHDVPATEVVDALEERVTPCHPELLRDIHNLRLHVMGGTAYMLRMVIRQRIRSGLNIALDTVIGP